MNSVLLKSFAKINLTLDVFPPRPDGYHNIRSIMQTISLHDVITIEKNSSKAIDVTVDTPEVPSGEGNLAYKAAVLVQEAAGLEQGVKIRISKNIPIQAGLGGGSSNGAAVLTGMNRLFGLDFEQERLIDMASELGSDAPFFIMGGTALAEGRGEKLSPLDDIPPLYLVIVKPDVGVPTSWAYSALDAVPDRQPGQSTAVMLNALKSGRTEVIKNIMSNDFEQVVYAHFTIIEESRKALITEGADAALLCGSGAAVFGVFSSERKTLEVAGKLKFLNNTYTSVTLTRAEACNPWL